METNDAEARGDREIRCRMLGLELRAAAEGQSGPGTMIGYAAVFDQFSEDLGSFREKIAPGAFREAIERSDVRALKNHDPGCLLGRARAGTLRLAEDELGLRVEIDLPDTQLGRDTAEEIRRRDLDGQSFAFTTDIDDWDYAGEVPIRTVRKVRELFDVGPVTYPAYTQTSAAMRSLEANRPAPPPAPDHHFLSLAKARQQLAEALLLPAE
jgi:HK97 family phage prohead protease